MTKKVHRTEREYICTCYIIITDSYTQKYSILKREDNFIKYSEEKKVKINTKHKNNNRKSSSHKDDNFLTTVIIFGPF